MKNIKSILHYFDYQFFSVFFLAKAHPTDNQNNTIFQRSNVKGIKVNNWLAHQASNQ